MLPHLAGCRVNPGTFLIPDETMLFWTGLGGHLTYMPRKPTPLGICLKTLSNAQSIILNMELVEGKAVDGKKEFYDEFGARYHAQIGHR